MAPPFLALIRQRRPGIGSDRGGPPMHRPQFMLLPCCWHSAPPQQSSWRTCAAACCCGSSGGGCSPLQVKPHSGATGWPPAVKPVRVACSHGGAAWTTANAAGFAWSSAPALLHMWSPLAVLAAAGSSLAVISNAAVIFGLYGAIAGSPVTAALGLATAADIGRQ